MSEEVRWLPLESNVDTFNLYIRNLGVKETCQFHDIYGFDEELAWVPKDCIAVLFIYPCRGPIKKMIKELEKKMEIEPQIISENVYYTKQTIKNACGTVGLLHILTNLLKQLDLDENSIIEDFYKKTIKLSPLERAKFLETYKPIEQVHEEIARNGDNQVVIEEGKESDFKNVDDHFISFVLVDGELYLLDGARNGAFCCGKTSREEFLKDAAKEMKDFIKMDEKSYHFSAMAFSKKKD